MSKLNGCLIALLFAAAVAVAVQIDARQNARGDDDSVAAGTYSREKRPLFDILGPAFPNGNVNKNKYYRPKKTIYITDSGDTLFITPFDVIRFTHEVYALRHYQCLVHRGPCDYTGNRLKASINELVNRNCSACTDEEYECITVVDDFVKNNYPECWSYVHQLYKETPTTTVAPTAANVASTAVNVTSTATNATLTTTNVIPTTTNVTPTATNTTSTATNTTSTTTNVTLTTTNVIPTTTNVTPTATNTTSTATNVISTATSVTSTSTNVTPTA